MLRSKFCRIELTLKKKPEQKRVWQINANDMAMKAENVLKDSLTAASVLALPWSRSQYTTEPDACDTSIGCVLLQEQAEKVLKPIDSWPMSLCNTERLCDTMHNEVLVVVWAFFMLRNYLEGLFFIVRTDHQSLRRMLYMKSLKNDHPDESLG